MKKLFILSFLLGLITICTAQEFSFKMNFVDAAGNKDSLILGYDPVGTDSLDPLFNEQNIILTPFASGLDVRSGNAWFMQEVNWLYGQTPFESKNQIVTKGCDALNLANISPTVEINIVSSHFPVTAYWDKSLFREHCNGGSLFSGMCQYGWCDVGPFGYFTQVMNDADSITFTQNVFNYLKGNDTVNVYWLILCDSALLGLSVIEPIPVNNSITVFPNPASDIITLNASKAFGDVKIIEFFNNLGQKVLTSRKSENISLTSIPQGFYYIQITNKNGLKVCTKFQKK